MPAKDVSTGRCPVRTSTAQKKSGFLSCYGMGIVVATNTETKGLD